MKLKFKTIFLDRDGVINHDYGYISHWKDFHFIDRALEALQIISKKKINIIIITNQSGIARGFYKIKDYEELTFNFKKFCFSNKINIQDIYYCPHHPLGKIKEFSLVCSCRKPMPGMIFKAINEHKIDIKNSALVGDKISDIKAGISAGIKNNFLIKTTINKKNDAKYLLINNLYELTELLV